RPPIATLFPYTTLFRSVFCSRLKQTAQISIENRSLQRKRPAAIKPPVFYRCPQTEQGCSGQGVKEGTGGAGKLKKVGRVPIDGRSEEHTSELQSLAYLV